jgi:hypothetical protein
MMGFSANVASNSTQPVPRSTAVFLHPSVTSRPSDHIPIGLPNHPSYPSGYSCISGAAAEILTAFFPERAAELDTHVIENGLSRIYGGIHYRFDVTARQVARAVGAQVLRFDRDNGS